MTEERQELAITVPDGFAAIRICPETDEQVKQLLTEATKLKEYALSRIILVPADLTFITDDLALIGKVKKALLEKKAEYLKPIKAFSDSVAGVFTLIMEPLEEADRLNRKKLTDYRAEIARKQAEALAINREKEELARREAALNHGEITIDTTPVEAPTQVQRVRTAMGTVGTQKVRKWELVDIKLVPDEYKLVDAAKVTKLVKAGIGSISGIRIWEEETIKVLPAREK